MGLALYTKADVSALVEDAKPFTVTFDGRRGGVITKRLYIHNNNSRFWYNDIKIQPVGSIANTSTVEDSFYWKLLEKDVAPAVEEWLQVNPGNQITLSSNLGSSTQGDIVTFLPFWVQIRIPRNQRVSVIKDMVLRINATENSING